MHFLRALWACAAGFDQADKTETENKKIVYQRENNK
jgi:hypothetical protein